MIQQIVGKCNRVVNESMPIVDASLENGARVNAVIYPVALNGPILTIRRFPDTPDHNGKADRTWEVCTPECAEFLETAGEGQIFHGHRRRNRKRKDDISWQHCPNIFPGTKD